MFKDHKLLELTYNQNGQIVVKSAKVNIFLHLKKVVLELSHALVFDG